MFHNEEHYSSDLDGAAHAARDLGEYADERPSAWEVSGETPRHRPVIITDPNHPLYFERTPVCATPDADQPF